MDKHLEEWIESKYLKEMEIGKKLFEKERSKSLMDSIMSIIIPFSCIVVVVSLIFLCGITFIFLTSENKPSEFAIECAIDQTLPQKLLMKCHSNTAIKTE